MRHFHSGYGAAVVDLVFDDERDERLHIIREVVASNGRPFEKVNWVLTSAAAPDEIMEEELGVALQGVITSKNSGTG